MVCGLHAGTRTVSRRHERGSKSATAQLRHKYAKKNAASSPVDPAAYDTLLEVLISWTEVQPKKHLYGFLEPHEVGVRTPSTIEGLNVRVVENLTYESVLLKVKAPCLSDKARVAPEAKGSGDTVLSSWYRLPYCVFGMSMGRRDSCASTSTTARQARLGPTENAACLKRQWSPRGFDNHRLPVVNASAWVSARDQRHGLLQEAACRVL